MPFLNTIDLIFEYLRLDAHPKRPIQCDACKHWYHGVCEKLSEEYWVFLGRTDINWLCTDCYNKLFPFYNQSDEELKLLFTDHNVEETLIFKKCIEFDNINPDYSPFNFDEENVNDVFKNQNTHYVTHEKLKSMKVEVNDNFSIIHFNARSLQKKSRKYREYASLL